MKKQTRKQRAISDAYDSILTSIRLTGKAGLPETARLLMAAFRIAGVEQSSKKRRSRK